MSRRPSPATDFSCMAFSILQKSFLGLVQTAPCRIDIEFKDGEGRPYQKLLKVKSKSGAEEEIPLYTTKDDFHGEARASDVDYAPNTLSNSPLRLPCRFG